MAEARRLRPRIIPVLLLRKSGLVKGEKFANHRYLGDAINTARIFNDKGVDELMLLDIDATREGRAPNYALIEEIAGECFMPLCYGGGVTTTQHMAQLYRLGCEKICLTSAAAENPALLEEAAARFGRQSVVAGIDVRKKLLGGYEVMTRAGTQAHKLSLEAHVREVTARGAGEILIQSTARDGTMAGYDLELIRLVRGLTARPLIAAGGAGSAADLAGAIRAGANAAAAGAMFVFQGKHRAVLVNVPRRAEIDAALAAA